MPIRISTMGTRSSSASALCSAAVWTATASFLSTEYVPERSQPAQEGEQGQVLRHLVLYLVRQPRGTWRGWVHHQKTRDALRQPCACLRSCSSSIISCNAHALLCALVLIMHRTHLRQLPPLDDRHHCSYLGDGALGGRERLGGSD